MGVPSPGDVTRLLIDWSDGNRAAVDQLMPLVYGELHRLAASYMRRERAGHTLQPTALVNEAYFRLVDQERIQWKSRAQFFGIAAQAMRRILVDHARGRQSAKRQGREQQVSLDDVNLPAGGRTADLVALDDALTGLARFDSRLGRVVELRVFGGLTIEETAAVLGVSGSTVINDYRIARAWLYRELRPEEGADSA